VVWMKAADAYKIDPNTVNTIEQEIEIGSSCPGKKPPRVRNASLV